MSFMHVRSLSWLPLTQSVRARRDAGDGDKRVLRAALRWLGLPRAAGRVKRAIQFGSRIGTLVNRCVLCHLVWCRVNSTSLRACLRKHTALGRVLP